MFKIQKVAAPVARLILELFSEGPSALDIAEFELDILREIRGIESPACIFSVCEGQDYLNSGFSPTERLILLVKASPHVTETMSLWKTHFHALYESAKSMHLLED